MLISGFLTMLIKGRYEGHCLHFSTNLIIFILLFYFRDVYIRMFNYGHYYVFLYFLALFGEKKYYYNINIHMYQSVLYIVEVMLF